MLKFDSKNEIKSNQRCDQEKERWGPVHWPQYNLPAIWIKANLSLLNHFPLPPLQIYEQALIISKKKLMLYCSLNIRWFSVKIPYEFRRIYIILCVVSMQKNVFVIQFLSLSASVIDSPSITCNGFFLYSAIRHCCENRLLREERKNFHHISCWKSILSWRNTHTPLWPPSSYLFFSALHLFIYAYNGQKE